MSQSIFPKELLEQRLRELRAEEEERKRSFMEYFKEWLDTPAATEALLRELMAYSQNK